jgi:Ca-activated chloride channel homolog
MGDRMHGTWRRASVGVLRAGIVVAGLQLVAMPVAAQGWLEPGPRLRAEPWNVVKLRGAVNVRIEGRVAHVEVEEWYRNDGTPFAEADYIHPLPPGAIFRSYSLFQGDTELTGETLDADEARQVYERIVRERRDPALIELFGNGMLRARVFPFESGEVRRITMRYTQFLDQSGDALQFRYAASRPMRRVVAGSDGAAVRARIAVRDSAAVRLRITVEDCDEFRDAHSPTHPLDVRREGSRMIVEPRTEVTAGFTMLLPPARRAVGISLLTHRPALGEDGYFMLMLSPDEVETDRVPRDVTAVVDVSGSMSGEKMEQARRALVQLLGTLADEDRFRLISFSSGVAAYRPGWTAATRAQRAEASRWIEALEVVGGTNIAGALDEAFAVAPGSGRLPVVIFLTDGMPTVGETDPTRIAGRATAARGDTRIFAFGVGYDVNTVLLDALSAAAKGSTQYVRPEEDVEVAVGLLAAKISHPVLTDLRIAGAPVRLREIYPVDLPDVFAGQDLVIFGRYAAARHDASGELAVHGRRRNADERFSAPVRFPAHDLTNDFLPGLWASRKLGELTRQIRMNGADPELVEEVRATALRYGLLSEYTAYLVLEPGAVPARRGVATGVSGSTAVASADAARHAREARTVADLQRAQEATLQLAAPAPDVGRRGAPPTAAGDTPGRRVVAGRYFTEVDGVWRDAGIDGSADVLVIEPLSDAWFQLIAMLPELRDVFATFERVEIGGRALTIRIAPGGSRTVTARELTKFR